MSLAFVKTPVGNKLFTVAWELEVPDAVTVVKGDPFEAVDCKLLSLYALTLPAEILCKFYASNYADVVAEPGFGVAVNISQPNNHIMVPFSAVDFPMFPPARWYWPSAEDAEGVSRISLLFEEIA